jgi:4-hydroxy-tetrahydrodipicolinate synthase
MKRVIQGLYTAIITPFSNGEIDWQALEQIVERQITAGVNGVVPCGTTGESPTLTHDEHDELISRVVKLANGRCQVIAGTGSNNTQEAVRLSRRAEECGVHACMVVNPYYNKPTQEGLYLHFREVANSVSCPIIVYNIPGRTGVNVETDNLIRLISDCSNILAVKEASGDLEQIQSVIKRRPEHFSVMSGDDNLTAAVIAAGGDGVISVASNIVPEQMAEFVATLLDGSNDANGDLSLRLNHLFELMFLETNPLPVKTAASMMGICSEEFRLPMCKMMEENRAILEQKLQDLSLLPSPSELRKKVGLSQLGA